MKRPSLQERLVKYLRHTHGYINGGELEKIAQAAGYKASNASRRLRVLEEASRGIRTTPEHERAAKILRGSVIEKIEKHGANSRVATVWYRLDVREPKPKFRYEPLPNGSVREVAVS